MKHTKFISMLLALMMVFGSQFATTALAASMETANTTSVSQQAEETEEESSNTTFGHQVIRILIIAAVVGLIAAFYGLTTMRYNADKMEELTEESRKVVQRMQDKDE